MDRSLKHHGILGMKWGVRRYQNPDGSLTPAGRLRYGSGDSQAGTGDNKYEKTTYNRYTYSDDELRDRTARLRAEKEYANLVREQKDASRGFVSKTMIKLRDRAVDKLTEKVASVAIDRLLVGANARLAAARKNAEDRYGVKLSDGNNNNNNNNNGNNNNSNNNNSGNSGQPQSPNNSGDNGKKKRRRR